LLRPPFPHHLLYSNSMHRKKRRAVDQESYHIKWRLLHGHMQWPGIWPWIKSQGRDPLFVINMTNQKKCLDPLWWSYVWRFGLRFLERWECLD
jgi:hypothetical protein